MNNVFVYCEIDKFTVEEVSYELLTKGRKLANELGVQLEAIAAGNGITGKVEKEILSYGVDKLHVFDAEGLYPYTSKTPYEYSRQPVQTGTAANLPDGSHRYRSRPRPRVSSSLTSGLTADCTALEIGDYDDKKSGKHYDGLLYQIRPAFGGNIVATIVNPDHRPQMATVRSGVMKAEKVAEDYNGEVIYEDVAKFVPDTDYVVKVIERQVEKADNNSERSAHHCGRWLWRGFEGRFRLVAQTRCRTSRRSGGQPCGCRCRLLRTRIANRSDRCNRASEGIYCLRYQRCHPACGRYEGKRHCHFHQHRPRSTH